MEKRYIVFNDGQENRHVNIDEMKFTLDETKDKVAVVQHAVTQQAQFLKVAMGMDCQRIVAPF